MTAAAGASPDAAAKRQAFHSFRRVAREIADHGWKSDLSLADFASGLGANPDRSRQHLALLGGGVGHLIDAVQSLDALYNASARQIGILCEIAALLKKQAESRRDPVADALIECWRTGPAALVPLDMSRLTVRARQAIRKAGCNSPSAVAALGVEGICLLRNAGITTANEIGAWLREEYGLTLKGYEEDPA